jgi:hypothetical protein
MTRTSLLALCISLAACSADTDSMGPVTTPDLRGRWRLLIDKQNGDADVSVIELAQIDGVLSGHLCSDELCNLEAISGTVEGPSIEMQWPSGWLQATADSSGDRFSGTIASTSSTCRVCNTRVEGTREGLDAGDPFGLGN